MIRLSIALAGLLAATSLTAAQTPEEAIRSFIDAPGFIVADAGTIENTLLDQWLDLTSITPGGTVGPIEKAVMIADKAITSSRTRTDIAYGEIIDAEGAPISLIEVRHFNLGPALHAMTVEAYGEEDTADIAEFGEGPHMAWRFAFQPLMNNSGVLIEASSRVISDKEAAKSECSGRPCLDATASFDAIAWEEIPGNLPSWPEIYATQSGEIATPAHAIAQLAVLGYWANSESGYYQWTGGEHPESIRGPEPYRFIAIDRDLGQDTGIDAVWRETNLNDDELSAISFRRADVAGQVYLMRASETWR